MCLTAISRKNFEDARAWGTTYPSPGIFHGYTNGSIVTVTAYPSQGYVLSSWWLDGSLYSAANPVYVTMNSPHNLTCYFMLNSGNESCPFVSTWNGTSYVLDNNILPQSETSNGTDVTDYYTLEQPLVPTNGQYALMLSEFEHEHSFMDYTQLLAVDHSANVNVGVSPSGQVLTYTHPYRAAFAITNEGKNVRQLLSQADGNYYQGYNGSYVTLNFGLLDVSRGAKLVIVSDMIIIKCPIYIQTLDVHGNWQTVATIYTRNHWATDVIDLRSYLPETRGKLMVRLCFVHNDTVDFVGLDTSPQARIDIHPGQLASALSSADGDVTANLLYADKTYAELLPGESIQLAFNLPEQTMQARTYIFIAEGHYYTITP